MAKNFASFGSCRATASGLPNAVPPNESAPNLQQLQFRDRLGCSPREACAALGVGRTLLYRLIAEHQVEVRKLGRRTIVSIPSLLKLLHGQAAEPKPRRRGRPRKMAAPEGASP